MRCRAGEIVSPGTEPKSFPIDVRPPILSSPSLFPLSECCAKPPHRQLLTVGAISPSHPLPPYELVSSVRKEDRKGICLGAPRCARDDLSLSPSFRTRATALSPRVAAPNERYEGTRRGRGGAFRSNRSVSHGETRISH